MASSQLRGRLEESRPLVAGLEVEGRVTRQRREKGQGGRQAGREIETDRQR